MSINFIPNDPDANDVPMRVVSPRTNRPSSQAGFDFIGPVPEKVYDPATQPAEFCSGSAAKVLWRLSKRGKRSPAPQ